MDWRRGARFKLISAFKDGKKRVVECLLCARAGGSIILPTSWDNLKARKQVVKIEQKNSKTKQKVVIGFNFVLFYIASVYV